MENESRNSYHYNSKDRMVNDISANDTWRHSSNFETLVGVTYLWAQWQTQMGAALIGLKIEHQIKHHY